MTRAFRTLLLAAALVSPVQGQLPAFKLGDGGIEFPDGTTQTSAAVEVGRIVTVAKSNGQFESIQAAIDSITDASRTNPYVVRIAPGEYEEQVTLRAGISLVGAGTEATVITARGGDSVEDATVIGHSDSAIRDLAVVSDGAGRALSVGLYNGFSGASRVFGATIGARDADTNYGVYTVNGHVSLRDSGVWVLGGSTSYGVYTQSPGRPTLRNSSVSLSGATHGVAYGVYNTTAGTPEVHNTRITCTLFDTCYGVYNLSLFLVLERSDIEIDAIDQAGYGVWSDSYPAMRWVSIDVTPTTGAAGYGVFTDGATTASIHHSRVAGSTHPVTGGNPKVAYSQLTGPKDSALPAGSCLGAYDEDYVVLDSSCGIPAASPNSE
jgi:hypothetical protein